ncbi:uncharacterized protein [Nothobranchius furzeri]|uniref:uncharacterized protein n=1 Tax=Nothobranchius furzeri TaxID=105023 RepID=UPI003904B1F6
MEGRAELYLQRSSSIQVGGDCGSAPFTSEDVTQGGGEGWRKAAADDGELRLDEIELQPGSIRVLATIFKNGNESSRKIYTVHTTEQQITHILSERPGFAVLKHHADFQEFVDVDSTTDIRNFDKFQVFLSSVEALPQTTAEELHQIQHLPVVNELGSLQILLQRKAPKILEKHKKTGSLKTESRKLLVKVCISHLVKKHGFYPTSAEKVTLAKTIVATFPSLRVQIEGKGEGFEHFYDPLSHSGFLEMRLRNIRRKLEAGQRRYSKRMISCDTGMQSEQDQGGSSATNEWITLMKRLRPSSENISSIKSAMENTYTRRRSWISKKNPTMAEILEEYPRFLDMPNLLDIEFGRMTDGKTELFIRRWEVSIIPKLKSLATMEGGDVSLLTEGMEDQTDDEKCYTMLVVLTHLLPPLPGSRCSIKSAISFLVDFVPAGTSIVSLCSNSEVAQGTQPQLICIGNLKSATCQYIIVASNDGVTIPVNDGLTCALDKLFKLYWVCNLAYPPQLSSVFTFFEYIYEVTISTNRKAKVLELISKLQAAQ